MKAAFLPNAMDEVRTIALEWMAKAKRDLEAAQRMIDCADPLLDTGTYHCQQAAELALRAAEKIVHSISEKIH
jgi:HEPN domain-containing protein